MMARSAVLSVLALVGVAVAVAVVGAGAQVTRLPVRADGTFKLLTFADMHFSRGEGVECSNLTPAEVPWERHLRRQCV
jgi:hypothetical protein